MSVDLALRSALGLFVAYFGLGLVWSLPMASHFSVLELCIISFSLSVGCLTLLMFFLGLLQILSLYSILSLVLIASVLVSGLGLHQLRKGRKACTRPKTSSSHISTITNPVSFAILMGIASLVFLSFYHALMFPQILWDTLTVYAFLGKRIYLESRIPLFSGSSGSVEWSGNYPMLVPMLYAWFNFSLGEVNELPSRSIFPVFSLATLVTTFTLARSLFGWTAAVFSVYVLAVTPIFFAHSTLGYIDIVLTYYFVSTLYFLHSACEKKDAMRSFLAGFSAGLAAWTKYQGLIIVFIVAAYWFLSRRDDEGVDSVFLKVLFVFAVTASPWYLRNCILLGNPVYPNLFTIFRGKNLDLWLLSYNHDYWVGRWAVLLGTDRSLDSLVRLPVRLLIKDNSIFSLGQDGVGLLLTCYGIPGLLLSILRRKSGDLLLLSSIFISASLWFGFLYYFIRYLLPIVPMVSILAGRLLCEIASDIRQSTKLGKVLLSLIILVPLSTAFLIPTGVLALNGPSFTFRDYVFSRPFAPPSAEEALRHAIPADYALWQFINERTPPNSLILTFDHRGYFVNRHIVFADGTEVRELYLASDVSQAVGFLRSVSVTHIVVEPWYKEMPLWYKSPLFRSLDNATYFSKVFDEQGFKVYEIKGAEI